MPSGPPPQRPPRVRAAAVAAFLPLALFAALLAITWGRWFSPFQDSGRELATAWRLATGEVLYRDVVYRYGPLPALLDDAAFRVAGVHAGALVALRVALALAGLWAMSRLARRLCGDRVAAAAAAGLVTATCFFWTGGGAYPFPYSVAALEGHVGTWVALELALSARGPGGALVAATVAGLAAGTKLELLPGALAGPLLALLLRRPRRESVPAAVLAVALAGLAWGLPVALLGRATMTTNGFLMALPVPEAWALAYRYVFWGGGTAHDFLSGGALTTLGPSTAFLGLAVLLVARRDGASAVDVFVPASVGALGFLVPSARELHALLPLAALATLTALVGAVSGIRSGRKGVARRGAAVLAVGASMLPALARQPFSLLATSPYAAFSAPLALLVATGFLSRRLGRGRASAFAGLLLGLTLAQLADRTLSFRLHPREEAVFPRGRFLLLTDEARLLRQSVEAARSAARPGEPFAVVPEGGIVNFLSDRRSPFADEQHFPGSQDAAGEELMVRALRERPPRGILVVDRSLAEFGARGFGDGYLTAFTAEMVRRYRPAARLGAPAGPGGPSARASTATLWLPVPR